jgi:hypothetical protein
MKNGVRARVLTLEQDLQDIIDGNHNGDGNQTELDVVVEIAKELISLLKGA